MTSTPRHTTDTTATWTPPATEGPTVAPVPRVTLNQREACEALGVSPATLRELEAEHGLPVRRIGRRAMYGVEALTRWASEPNNI